MNACPSVSLVTIVTSGSITAPSNSTALPFETDIDGKNWNWITVSTRNRPRSAELNLWREILSVSVSKVVTLVGGLLFIVLLARYFTVELLGLYLFVYAGVEFLVRLVDGLGKAVRKRVSETAGHQSEFFVAALTVAGGLYVAVALALVLLVGLVDVTELGGIFGMLTPALLGTAYLLFVAESFSKLAKHYVAGQGYPGRSEWFGKSFAGVVFFAATAVILVFELGEATAVFLAGAGAFGASALLLLAVGRPRLVRPSRETIRSLYAFGKFSVPNDITRDFYNSFDVFVLGVVVTAASVSYYEVSLQTAGLVYAVAYGVFATTNVTISGKHAQGEPVEPTLRDAISIAALLPVPMIVIAIAFGEDLLAFVFGGEYAVAYLFLVGLSIQQLFHGYRQCFAGFFYGIDRPSVNLRVNLLAVAVNVVTVLPLVAIFGGIGVVISTLVADVARLGAFRSGLQARLERVPIDRTVPATFGAGLTMLVVALVLAATVTVTPLTLGPLVLVSVGSYVAALLVLSEQFQLAAARAVARLTGD